MIPATSLLMVTSGVPNACGWRIEVKERKSGVSRGGFDYVSTHVTRLDPNAYLADMPHVIFTIMLF
jgi:hypothetical protein